MSYSRGKTSLQGQFYKTRMCPYLQKSKFGCKRKENCCYAHAESELQGTVDLSRTRLCNEYSQNGFCKKMNECQFAHGADELRSTNHCFKTQQCRKFSQAGFCPSGNSCRHAHGLEEAELVGRLRNEGKLNLTIQITNFADFLATLGMELPESAKCSYVNSNSSDQTYSSRPHDHPEPTRRQPSQPIGPPPRRQRTLPRGQPPGPFAPLGSTTQLGPVETSSTGPSGAKPFARSQNSLFENNFQSLSSFGQNVPHGDQHLYNVNYSILNSFDLGCGPIPGVASLPQMLPARIGNDLDGAAPLFPALSFDMNPVAPPPSGSFQPRYHNPMTRSMSYGLDFEFNEKWSTSAARKDLLGGLSPPAHGIPSAGPFHRIDSSLMSHVTPNLKPPSPVRSLSVAALAGEGLGGLDPGPSVVRCGLGVNEEEGGPVGADQVRSI